VSPDTRSRVYFWERSLSIVTVGKSVNKTWLLEQDGNTMCRNSGV